MKTTLLALVLLVSTLSFSQKFVATPKGLRDSSVLKNSFLTIKVEGKTASELFLNAKEYIDTSFSFPKEAVLRETENEFICIALFNPNFVSIGKAGVITNFDARYEINLSFAEGFVKYEIVNLRMVNSAMRKLVFTDGGADWAIFSKNGKLKNEELKEQIEAHFNAEVARIVSYLMGTEANVDPM